MIDELRLPRADHRDLPVINEIIEGSNGARRLRTEGGFSQCLRVAQIPLIEQMHRAIVVQLVTQPGDIECSKGGIRIIQQRLGFREPALA